MCWLRKWVDFKLRCEKDDDDKDKNKIDKVDIVNGIKMCDGKRGKRGLEWWWRCRETRDRAKKREEKTETDEREKV